MRYHSNEATKARSKIFLITLETEHELKVPVDSVIRVALSSLGTVKEIRVIDPEIADSPASGEEEISAQP